MSGAEFGWHLVPGRHLEGLRRLVRHTHINTHTQKNINKTLKQQIKWILSVKTNKSNITSCEQVRTQIVGHAESNKTQMEKLKQKLTNRPEKNIIISYEKIAVADGGRELCGSKH